MGKLQKYIGNPRLLYCLATTYGLTRFVPDEAHLKAMYKSRLGDNLDLDNPQSFNEKLQWLKLHDRNPLYTTLVDKYAVKEWVSNRVGSKYVTETYAKWNTAEEVDITNLPEKFVLKTNHDCGGVVICSDRSSFDLDAAKRKLRRHLKRNYYFGGREWPYKNVKPCIFAEEYLEPDPVKNGLGSPLDLPDYKLFHFSNGRIVTLAMTDRFTSSELTKTFFDENWRPLDVSEGGHPRNLEMPVPHDFELMKRLADELADGFPFARVDFYESGGRLFFGEMTFYPNSGFEQFCPVEWDERFGSWIDLPSL